MEYFLRECYLIFRRAGFRAEHAKRFADTCVLVGDPLELSTQWAAMSGLGACKGDRRIHYSQRQINRMRREDSRYCRAHDC